MSAPTPNQDGRIAVIFRMSRKTVYAVFPNEPVGSEPALLRTIDEAGNTRDMMLSTFKSSTPASALQYGGLMAILERRGWKLDVRQKITAEQHEVRRTRCLATRHGA